MNKNLSLKILLPCRLFFAGDVSSVSVPGALGIIEIYSQHTNLVSTLTPGYVQVTMIDKSVKTYFTNGGYIEVSNDVSLLLDDVINENDITKDYLSEKLSLSQQKLESISAEKISDYEYEMLTQEIALYQQYIAA